jgi:hypothetical protein
MHPRRRGALVRSRHCRTRFASDHDCITASSSKLRRHRMARNAKQGPEQPATVAMSARARTESDGRSEGGRDCGTRSDGGRAGRRNGTCTSWRRTRERHRWSLRQGTATEGIHLGAVAGAGDLVQRALTGIEVSGDMPRLSPQLREEVNRLDMRMCSHEPEPHRSGSQSRTGCASSPAMARGCFGSAVRHSPPWGQDTREVLSVPASLGAGRVVLVLRAPRRPHARGGARDLRGRPAALRGRWPRCGTARHDSL